MNFYPDKQHFQVAGAWDQTTDPWVLRPALYPHGGLTKQKIVMYHESWSMMSINDGTNYIYAGNTVEFGT